MLLSGPACLDGAKLSDISSPSSTLAAPTALRRRCSSWSIQPPAFVDWDTKPGSLPGRVRAGELQLNHIFPHWGMVLAEFRGKNEVGVNRGFGAMLQISTRGGAGLAAAATPTCVAPAIAAPSAQPAILSGSLPECDEMYKQRF